MVLLKRQIGGNLIKNGPVQGCKNKTPSKSQEKQTVIYVSQKYEKKSITARAIDVTYGAAGTHKAGRKRRTEVAENKARLLSTYSDMRKEHLQIEPVTMV